MLDMHVSLASLRAWVYDYNSLQRLQCTSCVPSLLWGEQLPPKAHQEKPCSYL